MKSATLYERKGKLLFHASSRTTDGVWVCSEPIAMIDGALTAAEKGRVLMDVLDGSRTGVAHPSPSSWPRVFDSVLELAEVKSMRTFSRAAKCCFVRFDAGSLSITPTRNGGSVGGFEHLNERTIVVSDIRDEEIGIAMNNALALCVTD